MNKLVVTTEEELVRVLNGVLLDFGKSSSNNTQEIDERLDQKSAARFIGISEQTLIRWRRNKMVPFEAIPGSSKIFFYKSQLKAVLRKNHSLLANSKK